MSCGKQRGTGEKEPEFLHSSFVYPDGFQMLVSDRSATERHGGTRQPGGPVPAARTTYKS